MYTKLGFYWIVLFAGVSAILAAESHATGGTYGTDNVDLLRAHSQTQWKRSLPEVTYFPDRFDWRDYGCVTTPRNQGGCNACWAFASVGALESVVLIETSIETDLSEQQLVSCNRAGIHCADWGGLEDAYEVFLNPGAIEEACMPYVEGDPDCVQGLCTKVARIRDFHYLGRQPTSEMKGYVIQAPVPCTMYFEDPGPCPDGLCFDYPDREDANHGILVIGWDDDLYGGEGGWICKDSRGESRWDGGYFYVKYDLCDLGYHSSLLEYEPVTPVNLVFGEWQAYGQDGQPEEVVDPGEIVDLQISLSNSGDLPATDVTAEIESLHPSVEILQESLTFDTIAPGDVVGSNQPYCRLRVGNDLQTPVDVWIQVNMYCPSDTSIYRFELPVGRGVVYVNSIICDDTTWASDSIYVVAADISVCGNTTLTIEPGTIVKFMPGCELWIDGGGSSYSTLMAVGTEADSIVFTSWFDDSYGGDTNGDSTLTNASPGDWEHIRFQSSKSTQSIMQYCVVQYGGGGGKGNVCYQVYSGTSVPRLEQSLIANSSNYGVYCAGSNPGISGNTIRWNESFAMALGWGASPTYGGGNTIVDNTYDGIDLIGGDWDTATLEAGDVPYVATGDIYVGAGATLTIEPGAIVKFKPGCELWMDGYGDYATLMAVGTEADSIVFTSWFDDSYGGDTNGDSTLTNASPGDWEHIRFQSSKSIQSIMQYCVVRYGGGGGKGNICYQVYSGSSVPRLEQSLIANSSNYGVYCAGSNPGISGNTIRWNESFAMALGWGASPTYGGGNTIVDNTYDGIDLIGGDWDTATLEAGDVPYVATGYIYVGAGATLTIEPGAIVKFKPGCELWVDGGGSDYATLMAVGTEADSIVFTSWFDDSYGGDTNGDSTLTIASPGDWKHIGFQSSKSIQSIMQYCVVRYGGGGGKGNICYQVYSGSSVPRLERSLIANSSNYGIYCASSNPGIEQCTITSCASHGINCTGCALPLVHHTSLIGDSEWYGIYTECTGDTVDATDNWWGHDTGPHDPSPVGLYNPGGQGSRVSDYVSYVPWLSGLGPELFLEPHSISDTLVIDSTKVERLYIMNSGPAALAFEISEAQGGMSFLGDTPLSGSSAGLKLADIAWLSVDPEDGTVVQGDTCTVMVSLDASGLSYGAYSAYLVITNNDADNNPTVVPINVHVCTPAGVDRLDSPTPERFYLFTDRQSLPGGAIHLTFGLPSYGRLTCRIYDITGRLISVPLDGPYEAGHHETDWEVCGCTENRLSSGVYFLRSQFGRSVITRRILVLR